jgi:acetylornithine deacetylase/succinyl-diaminopimelate desuccinylase-like protein
MDERRLLAQIDRERLAVSALALARIPSPTGRTREAAEHYAAELAAAGMAVELVREWPEAPAVCARLHGRVGARAPTRGDDRTLTRSDHLDHVDLPHTPARLEEGVLHGRGTADMKGALACAAEAVRVLQECGVRLGGHLQILAHGLHELPAASEDLAELCRRGLAGTAAIVCECGSETAGVAQKGLGRFSLRIRRDGGLLHELRQGAGAPNPALLMGRVLSAFEAEQVRLAAEEYPLVGSETLFAGQARSGTAWNLLPAESRIEGTRRWAPGRDAALARAELERLIERALGREKVTWSLRWQTVRESFATDPEADIVRAVRDAYRAVTGLPLPLAATAAVADGALFAREAGIPVVYHGPGGRGIHGPRESVPVDELVRATGVYILAACHYLGTA